MILPGQRETFYAAISALSDSGMMPYVMLVGSWAEYIYESTGVFNGYESSMRTRDIDFMVMNLRKPPDRTDFSDRMKDSGFVLDTSRGTGIQRFVKYDVDMEIEFLLRELGAGGKSAYHVESLGINVPGLRNFDILAAFPMAAAYKGIDITVPVPEAYAVHKLVINKQRSAAKRGKDITAVELIIRFIMESQRGCFFKEVWSSLSKKQQKLASATASKNHIEIGDLI